MKLLERFFVAGEGGAAIEPQNRIERILLQSALCLLQGLGLTTSREQVIGSVEIAHHPIPSLV